MVVRYKVESRIYLRENMRVSSLEECHSRLIVLHGEKLNFIDTDRDRFVKYDEDQLWVCHKYLFTHGV